ncbi:hypothetical protein [Streptomyces sp. MMG1121]|uniref:hypothetical protein n=1 Tax=Streptomyces sp. MMG1121 TaxID=1415544 RepID=UPI000A653316|nr:hypothetical protein [Streptomyces sp. MMG1121]
MEPHTRTARGDGGRAVVRTSDEGGATARPELAHTFDGPGGRLLGRPLPEGWR